MSLFSADPLPLLSVQVGAIMIFERCWEAVPPNPDGLSSIMEDPVHRDGCPISDEPSECRDGFPSTGDTEYSVAVFLRDSHTGENSERVRESDSGVQIVTASGIPSELSAHQMGLSLAGASRLKEEPIHSIPGTSAIAIDGHEQLSISDRALLRKYGLSGRRQESTREPEAHHGTIPIVQRVDGHPPQADLNLYDRMLLRKYTVPATASMLSDLASVPPVSPPVESTKKRRRFFRKGKLSRDTTREVGQVREGSPCGFQSQVAEPPVRAGTSVSFRLRVLSLPISLYCIILWSEMELYRWVICRNLLLWRHLLADPRTGCKLQQLLSQIPLRP